MNLSHAIRIMNSSRIAFVGAGGKTSTIFQLANEYPGRVMVTTTTHVGTWQIDKNCEQIKVQENANIFEIIESSKKKILFFTSGYISNERIKGLDQKQVNMVRKLAENYAIPLLIEADGSRQLPIKAPAIYEPVIPEFVDTVVVMASLQCLGKLNNDKTVHRPELFERTAQCPVETEIKPGHLIHLFLNKNGGLKGIPSSARKIALMTHCDNSENLRDGKQISDNILSHYETVLLTRRKMVLAVYERSAGIILAAGGSTRYKGNKLLVDWKGIPLVRYIVEQALQSKLDSIVVVVGNKAEEIRKALQGLPIQIILNKQWQLGISSSIKAGLQGLRGCYGCAMIMQADQPFLSTEAIDALLKKHLEDFCLIIGLKVHGKRSTPTLFDQTLFHELGNLAGDQGGSQLFAKYPPLLIPWNDRRLLLDIDSTQDLVEVQKRNTRGR